MKYIYKIEIVPTNYMLPEMVVGEVAQVCDSVVEQITSYANNYLYDVISIAAMGLSDTDSDYNFYYNVITDNGNIIVYNALCNYISNKFIIIDGTADVVGLIIERFSDSIQRYIDDIDIDISDMIIAADLIDNLEAFVAIETNHINRSFLTAQITVIDNISSEGLRYAVYTPNEGTPQIVSLSDEDFDTIDRAIRSGKYAILPTADDDNNCVVLLVPNVISTDNTYNTVINEGFATGYTDDYYHYPSCCYIMGQDNGIICGLSLAQAEQWQMKLTENETKEQQALLRAAERDSELLQ